MKVLITGKGGKSGSWAIRAAQLGEALGAIVQPMAEPSECRAADVIVIVKRAPAAVLSAVRSSGRPWVYDVVDGWPQPHGNAWDRSQAVGWMLQRLRELSPSGVVFGTQQMQADCSGWGEGQQANRSNAPSLVLPHHAWPKYAPVAVRHHVRAVGYEGDPSYLGRWAGVLVEECRRRGWQFVINGDMQQVDIGIALRDPSGYAPRHWKPGTKLANLQALGVPALCSPEQGCRDLSNGTEYWVEHPDHVIHAFNELVDPDVRSAISVVQQQSALGIDSVAETYRAWLKTFH